MTIIQPITRQQILDRNQKWFVRNRKPLSINENGTCLYRGPHGRRCAIGIVMSDSVYKPGMDADDGLSITEVIGKFGTASELFSVAAKNDFLTKLQAVHDGLSVRYGGRLNSHMCQERVEAYDLGLQRLAFEFNLKYPTPKARIRSL